MRLTSAIFGAFAGGAYGVVMNKDPWKSALWGGGIGLVLTLIGGASLSVGGISLRVGADGVDVFRAQTMLNQLGYHTSMSGTLGPDTVSALKRFQASMGLTSDGTLTNQTFNLLQQLSMPGPS
jgi:peptidoglycan hydrolase-like protein with peptidoglycan-binding domain